MKSLKAQALLIILSLFLSCASYNMYTAKDMAPALNIPVAARDYLYKNQKAPDGFGAYGYVVFTSRPYSDEYLQRYVDLCKAFNGALEETGQFSSRPDRNIMPTFWLLDQTKNGGKQTVYDLIRNYDYARGAALASLCNKTGIQGPLLVAWTKPYEDVTAGDEALILDMSGFNDSDFHLAVNVWKEHIIMKPENRQPSFLIEKIRLAIRSQLRNRSGAILSALEIFKKAI